MVIAIIGDIVNSKQLKKRGEVQASLKQSLENINELFSEHIVSKMTLTLGDEFQGLLKIGSPICQIIDRLESEHSDLQIRYGIGIGEILTEINPELSLGADGPAFWYAREAIEYFNTDKDYGRSNTYLVSSKTAIDLVNDVLALTANFKKNMTEVQRKRLDFLIQNGIYSDQFDQKKIAKQMGISESALSKSLKAGNIKLYLGTRQHLDEYLKEAYQ
ncbi:MAG: DNA-binding protein [Erysipelothrix sp.]|nr:DNA-binding protein [Erysipelothrix sp.]